MPKNVNIEKEKSFSDDNNIIIEDGSNEESAEHMPIEVGTSSIQPPIISIDLDNDDSVFVGVSDSPPIVQMGKFHEKDIGINLDVVYTVVEQILSQGIDALASIA